MYNAIVHAYLQAMFIDLTAMPVSGQVFIGQLPNYSSEINAAFAGRMCGVANASVCAYNAATDTQVRYDPQHSQPTGTLSLFTLGSSPPRNYMPCGCCTVPQIACVYTDTDGFYNLGITVGVTVRLNVTMGGEQPDCIISQ